MLLHKQDYPEENDLVVCTVTKLQFHSVFVNIDEYGRKSGMIHISEISPGRIRNIRDYVKEGKVIVCKVLKVNKERDHIDLSLRRVNENQRRAKISEMKQEQIAEKITEFVAKKHDMDAIKTLLQIYDKVKADYALIYTFFEDIVEDNSQISKLGFPKKVADDFLETIKQRIKPPEVKVEGKLEITSFEANGVEDIRNIGKELHKTEGLSVRFLGGGAYNLELIDSNYKDAEKKLKLVIEAVEKYVKKIDGEMSFKRVEN